MDNKLGKMGISICSEVEEGFSGSRLLLGQRRLLTQLGLVLENREDSALFGRWGRSAHRYRWIVLFAEVEQFQQIVFDIVDTSPVWLDFSQTLNEAVFGRNYCTSHFAHFNLEVAGNNFSNGLPVLRTLIRWDLPLRAFRSRIMSSSRAEIFLCAATNSGGSILLCLASSSLIFFSFS